MEYIVPVMQRPTFKEALRFWFKLGFISFGGTAGHIALMHDLLVDKKSGSVTVVVGVDPEGNGLSGGAGKRDRTAEQGPCAVIGQRGGDRRCSIAVEAGTDIIGLWSRAGGSAAEIDLADGDGHTRERGQGPFKIGGGVGAEGKSQMIWAWLRAGNSNASKNG
jgi:hypothetical protein